MTVASLNHRKSKFSSITEWIPFEGTIEALRMIKDSDEIGFIRRAVQFAEDSYRLVKPMLSSGTTEREFALELEFAMRRAGADAPSFDTIVASGPNGAYPHYRTSDREFAPGNLVTIDWGAQFHGYCSDITRTVVIPGAPPSEKQLEIYSIVLEAQRLAIAAIAPGVLARDVDAVARDFIASHGYGDCFGHSVGHSIGRAVHDGATLSQRAGELRLKPGMVTTVEPGIYIEGLGGVRIEEDVLVTETGAEVLTSLERQRI